MASENDYLTPDQIEAIRSEWAEDQRARGTVNGPRPIDLLIAKLLRHLRALTAPADGEALGREVRDEWIAWAREQPSPKPSWLVPWEGLSEPDREVDRRIGLRCHAAGALSREGEIVALRSERDALAKRLDLGPAEVVTLAAWEEQKAEIARLTAEIERREQDRAEGVKDIDRLCGHLDLDMLASVNECADEGARLRREVDRLAAELAEEQDAHRVASKALCDQTAELRDARDAIAGPAKVHLEVTAERDAARADGAREEREACSAIARGDHGSFDAYGIGETIAEKIEARGAAKR